MLSGLVPLALIVGAAACYGRARPGFRAVLALVFGSSVFSRAPRRSLLAAAAAGCRWDLPNPEHR